MCAVGTTSPRPDAVAENDVPATSPAAAPQEELPYIEPTMVPPCKHNRWMRQRIRLAAPSTNLECLTCGVVWTTNLDKFDKCREFYHARCTLGSDCPYPHIYAQGVSRIIKAGGPELTLKEFRKGVAEARRAGVYETVDEVLEWMVPYAKRLKGMPETPPSGPASTSSILDNAPPRSPVVPMLSTAVQVTPTTPPLSVTSCASGEPQAVVLPSPMAGAAADAERSPRSESGVSTASSGTSTLSSVLSSSSTEARRQEQLKKRSQYRHNPYGQDMSIDVL